MARSARWRPALWPAAIVLAVLLANAPGILGITNVNPLDTYAGLTSYRGASLIPGTSTIDINVGATSQALGHRAALDWLAGHVPWWNPYEGLGTPLAAGMQSAAFFPLTLLVAWSGGQLAERLILEMAAGLFTYLLLRKLGVRDFVAGAGGIAFALNGTFAWFQHAAINPVAFLPAALLGVEIARDRRLGDWRNLLLPLALALSIAAGFPETAFFDGVLVLLWAALRAGQQPTWEDRGRLAARLAVLGLGGVLLTAPLVLAFTGYLRVSVVGAHPEMAHVHLPVGNLLTFIDPYLIGPLKAFSPVGNASVHNLFITNSGYVLVSGVALGLVGLLLGRRELGVRILLGLWILVVSLRDFGAKPVMRVLAHVPYVHESAVFRSAVPAVELAVVLLACLGVEALAAAAPGHASRASLWWRRGRMAVAAACVAALLGALSAGPSNRVLHLVLAGRPGGPNLRGYVIGAVIASAVVLVALAIGGALRGGAAGAVLCSVLALEAAASFVYPELAGTRSPVLDSRPVAYLQAHLGTARFYSLSPDPVVGPVYGGPISPNYGSYFGLAEADYLDIPVPALYARLVHARLDAGAGAEFFGTERGRRRHDPGAMQELASHIRGFEAIGVRYVVTGAQVPFLSYVPTARRVYHDDLVGIWKLPSATPFFSVLRGSCLLRPEGFDSVRAACHTPALLRRAELALPGWSATVNGHPVRLGRGALGVFSTVAVPAGTSTVTWSYSPDHLGLGELLALLGLVMLAAPFGLRPARAARAGGAR